MNSLACRCWFTSAYLLNAHGFCLCVPRLWVDCGQWHRAKQDGGLRLVHRGLWESGAGPVWRETPHIPAATGQGMNNILTTNQPKLRLVTPYSSCDQFLFYVVMTFCLKFELHGSGMSNTTLNGECTMENILKNILKNNMSFSVCCLDCDMFSIWYSSV